MLKRPNHVGRYLLLSAVALVSLASPTFAQPAPAATDAGKIEKVTVTAQKRTQNAQDIPATVNALNGKNIKDLGIKSSDRIAQYISGLTINLPSGQGNQPIISIRGIGNNDFNTNNAGPNGIYSDEVYLSAPSSQTFLTFDLDRIEVLKGPQGTLYGRNTSGGAINFISNKPSLGEFSAGATAAYSSFDTYEVEGFLNAETGDTSAGRIAAIWNKSDGFMKNLENGKHVGGTDGYAIRGQWLVKPIEGLDVLFNVHGSKVDALPTVYHQVGAAQFNGVGFDPCNRADIDAGLCTDVFFYNGPTNRYQGRYNRKEHLDNESTGGSVRFDYDLGDMTLTAISAVEHNDKLHPEDSDASPLSLLEIDFGVNSDTFTQEVRLAHESTTLNWVAGLYYLDETLTQDQVIRVLNDADLAYGAGGGDCPPVLNATTPACAFIGTSRSNQDTTAYAAFGQADFEIFDRTRLTLGGRYTNESRDFDTAGSIVGQTSGIGNFSAPQTLWGGIRRESIDKSAFSWKAAIDHRFAENVMAYASFSTGFKSGGFNGGFLDVDPTFFAAQVAPVRPETNKAYEVGIKSDLFDNTLRFNASAFYYDYKDLQLHTLVQTGSFPIDVLDNVQKSTIKGVDIDAVAKPVENLTLRVNAEWLDAKLDQYTSSRSGPAAVDYSGKTLPNAPKFSLTGIAEYTIPLPEGDAIDLMASASYRGKVFFDPANEPLIAQPFYWVLDTRVAYSIDDGRWQLAAFGRNLGDEEYLNMAFDLRGSFGLLQEIVAPPRTFGIEASFRY